LSDLQPGPKGIEIKTLEANATDNVQEVGLLEVLLEPVGALKKINCAAIPA